MCGIAGIVYADRHRPVDPHGLALMCDALRHRGPDDRGIHTGAGFGLGHQRLAVIDLTDAGRQPMSNEDGTVWVVYNGEIYNFLSLRRELEESGHHFRSRTDSEVIVHLYEELGDDCVHRLHGMFAFALWDDRRRRLLLARDRLGKKPLKFVRLGDGIAFASELKALLHAGIVRPEVDLDAIDEFLSLGYVPSPATGFQGIRKLPAAHRLVWQDGRCHTERYWELDFRDKRERPQQEWVDEVREHVRTAVERRLVSDVPLGAFLSGGMDSSIVTACMARRGTRPVQTFSIGFSAGGYDELPWARVAARHLHTSHSEFTVEPEMATLLPELARTFEEPYADASALPTYFLAREARRAVTVALSGDGGDEGFAGYPRYARILSREPWLPWIRGSGARVLARRLLDRPDGLPSPRARSLERFLAASHPDLRVRYVWMLQYFSELEKAGLYDGPLRERPSRPGSRAIRQCLTAPQAGRGALDRMLYADTMSYLPDDLLVKTDMASMAHGLEVRCPLLDHELLELAASAPSAVKRKRNLAKRLLNEAFRDALPPELLERPKQGFEIPLAQWFRGPLRPVLDELVLSPQARTAGWFRRGALHELVRQHQTHRADHGRRLWALTMLELWYRSCVESADRAGPVDRVETGYS